MNYCNWLIIFSEILHPERPSFTCFVSIHTGFPQIPSHMFISLSWWKYGSILLCSGTADKTGTKWYPQYEILYWSDEIILSDQAQDSWWQVIQYSIRMEHVVLAAITKTTILVPYLVKSLPLIWRPGTRRWNLRVPGHQMSCSDLTRMRGYQETKLPHLIYNDSIPNLLHLSSSPWDFWWYFHIYNWKQLSLP